MSCYVDPLYGVKSLQHHPEAETCHLIADTHEELIGLGHKLNLGEADIQHRGKRNEHLDLTPEQRELAIELGAIEISYGELCFKTHKRKKNR